MTETLDDATRAAYLKLTTAMSMAEIMADPQKNSVQVEMRQHAIRHLLSPLVARDIFDEHRAAVLQALRGGTPALPHRCVAVVYASMPALLRKLLGVGNDQPVALNALTLEEARVSDPNSVTASMCDPTKHFVFVVATALGSRSYLEQTRSLLILPPLPPPPPPPSSSITEEQEK
jgi:hypothetical protein